MREKNLPIDLNEGEFPCCTNVHFCSHSALPLFAQTSDCVSFCICLFIRKCAKFVSVRACLYDGLFIGSFPLSSRGMARIFIVIAWYGNGIVLRYSVGCNLNKIQTLNFWLKCSHFVKSKLEMSELSNHTDMPNNTQTKSFARIRNKHTTAKSMGHPLQLQSYCPLLGPLL